MKQTGRILAVLCPALNRVYRFSFLLKPVHPLYICASRSAGPEAVEAQCQRLEVRSKDGGRLLFTADEEEAIMTTEKFTVTGKM